MIHASVTTDLIHEWAGTTDEIRWYEYEITPAPHLSDDPDDALEDLASRIVRQTAAGAGLTLVGEPIMFRNGQGILVVWRLPDPA